MAPHERPVTADSHLPKRRRGPRRNRRRAPGGRVRALELLRAGRTDETLFLVPGLEGDPAELSALVAAFTGPQAVYCRVPPTRGRAGGAELGMQELAAVMLIGCPVSDSRRAVPAGRLLLRRAGRAGDGPAVAGGGRDRRGAVPDRRPLRRAVLAARDLAAGAGPADRVAAAAHRPDASAAGVGELRHRGGTPGPAARRRDGRRRRLVAAEAEPETAAGDGHALRRDQRVPPAVLRRPDHADRLRRRPAFRLRHGPALDRPGRARRRRSGSPATT